MLIQQRKIMFFTQSFYTMAILKNKELFILFFYVRPYLIASVNKQINKSPLLRHSIQKLYKILLISFTYFQPYVQQISRLVRSTVGYIVVGLCRLKQRIYFTIVNTLKMRPTVLYYSFKLLLCRQFKTQCFSSANVFIIQIEMRRTKVLHFI